jgi:DnaK suppressor protein
MDAMQVQAMALETKRRRDLGMLRIKAALKRIEEEEFGWCLSCGEEIAFKRLQWDPSTPNCIGCAS